MKTSRFLLVGALSFLIARIGSFAAAPEASGKWKWNFERNGESIEILMNLKQEGSKLNGRITGREGREFEIREGKISDDGKLGFHIKIERDDGSTMQIDFRGKLASDTITGQTEYTNREGEKREHEWVAKREKARDLTGRWKSEFKRQDGSVMESTLKLKQNGEKLAGTHAFNNGSEAELQDGKVQADEVSFKIVRDRDGRTVTSIYRGKIQADLSIKGQIESDWTGEVRRLEWEARKEKD